MAWVYQQIYLSNQCSDYRSTEQLNPNMFTFAELTLQGSISLTITHAPEIWIPWRTLSTAIPFLATRSQQNFAHATTARLSCHVQNCAPFIWSDLYESEMDFLIKFRFWWRIVSEKVPSPGYHGSGIYESGTLIIMKYGWFRDLYSRKWLHPMVYWVLEIWYVAMVAVTGCTTLVPYLLVKPLQLIRRSGIRKFHLYTDARSLNEL